MRQTKLLSQFFVCSLVFALSINQFI